MYIGNNDAIRGCQEYFNRCSAAGSPIGATQTPSSYDNAASFNGTNQFLSIPSNSTLTVTGTSFTFAFWVNAVNVSNSQFIVIKQDVSGSLREYQILIAAGALRFSVFPDGTFANRRELDIPAGPVNSWNFYVCRYDAAAGTMGTSINGGAFATISSVPAITQTNTNPFYIGSFPSVLPLSGALSSVGFWKKALTASEVTQLWNAGAGRTYASLDSGLRTNLVSWWALNQNSVTADSAPTGNNLTNNGTPLVTATTLGPIVTALSDPRQLIVDFAQGIDQLGLWNSMVCWPLRSSQNAGSGTTAFSLGGLGQFNGTLVNAPVWGANGMIFASASGTRINISNDPIFAPQNTTWGAMCVSSQTSGTRADVFGKTGSVDALADLSWGMRESNTTATLFITDGATFGGFNVSSTGLNLFRSSVMSYDNTLITGRVNGGAASTLSYTPNAQQNTSQVLRIGAGTLASATNFNGPVAFALFGYFSASQQVALHSLYRQTLGLGLNLP
jgi:hypothetical protein